jgi:4-diphosphocytidyl-2-C-methyl-D-erythritol kinase
MTITARSFAKINLGLRIGLRREDGFHALRTVYQTVAIHDRIDLAVGRGSGIEIECANQRVPRDEGNTCWRVAERVLRALNTKARVRITIHKRLPVQGGMGAGSSNGVVTMLALERALKKRLPAHDRLRIAAEVGSDLPLFLLGGTVLGSGRGEEIYPLENLPVFDCVVATPAIGISTPAAFADWDEKCAAEAKLTGSAPSDRMNMFSHSVYEWLSGSRFTPTGVPGKGRDRAEALLLDPVRTGIENDFESVVFPMYPALREVKSALERAGAKYASHSGSGSTVYGLFASKTKAAKAARLLNDSGTPAQATVTLTRDQYWKRVFAR